MARKSRKNTGNSSEMMTAPKKVFQAALYVRISVENEQKIEADSIGTQIQMLKDFASQMPEIQVYDIYCDNDITGTTFVRPEFSRMMNDVRDHRINCIIVKDLSRLGRNYLESGEYLEKVFPFFELRFIAINDRIDTLERPVDISAQLKNMVNELYAKDISRKICSTMRTLQEQGKFIGSQPPYGYLRNPEDKYSLIVDSETAPVVRKIFAMVLEGYTVHSITLYLNEQGIASPGRYKYEKGLVKNEKFRKSLWFFSTTRKMLSDPVYLGWIQNGKSVSNFSVGGQKSVPVPKEEWKVIKGVHEPIIEERVFNQVQEILGRKDDLGRKDEKGSSANKREKGSNAGRYQSKHNQNNILRGKLYCGECGKAMVYCQKESHGKKQMWYCCPMHNHYNSRYCPKKSVKKAQMEQMILAVIKKQMSLFVEAEQVIWRLNRSSMGKGKYAMYQSQIKGCEKQLAQYTEKKAALYQDYAERMISEEDYMIIGQEYSKKADELTLFLTELKKEAEKYSPEYCGSEKWKEKIEKYREQEVLSREMVEALIERITAYQDGRVEIQLQNCDELEILLYYAAERKREEMKYAG